MKSSSSLEKRWSVLRYTLILVLLLAMAAWTVSVSAADEPGGPNPVQIVVKPLPPAPFRRPTAGTTAQVHPTPPGATQPGSASSPRQAPLESAAKSLGTLLGQISAATEPPKEPEKLSAIVKKTAAMLDSPKFTFLPDKALDPFVPFASLQPVNDNGGPGAGGFLTPLQKMSLAEMEGGLKAIVSGGLGKMAEDFLSSIQQLLPHA